MKYTLLMLVSLLLSLPIEAQNQEDEVIFKAMNDEMERSLEKLKLPDVDPLFYVAYKLERSRQFVVTGTLGSVVSARETPWAMAGTVQMFLGNYHRNSNINGQITQAVSLPWDVDYEGIRRGYWLASDLMYKLSMQLLVQKNAFLKNNPVTPEEEKLDDWQSLPPVTRHKQREKEYVIDILALEKIVKELSAVFLNYKEIYNTSVSLSGVDGYVYKVTSEGAFLKEPQGAVVLQVGGMVNVLEGSALSDGLAIYVETPDKLPALEELKKRIITLAEGMMKRKDAPRVEEFYSGPVMFEEAAVASILGQNLLQPDGLLAYRVIGNPLQGIQADRFGRPIIDKRITIKHYTALKQHDGIDLLGGYDMDAEGVNPLPEMTLVEKGVFKQMLNGRTPALNAPKSTGSSRFEVPQSNLMSVTAPGIIHVQVEKATKLAKMKEKLIKMAKAQGLGYAYIVRSLEGVNSQIFRLDVKSGEEKQMRGANVPFVYLSKLTDLADISDEDRVDNYMWGGSCFSTLIYPAALIVRSLDINTTRPKTEKAPVLKYPLQR